MTADKAAKTRRASARRAADPAPQDERLDRLEAMMLQLSEHVLRGERLDKREPQPIDDEDEEDDRPASASERQRQRQIEDKEEQDALAALGLVEPRHLEIFHWLARMQGKSNAQLVKEIMRGALIRERPAFREAQGKGGASSRNLEALAERLPARK